MSIGDIHTTLKIAKKIQNNKIAIKPILPPTVKIGEERIRICIHSFNKTEEIEALNQIITSCCNKN